MFDERSYQILLAENVWLRMRLADDSRQKAMEMALQESESKLQLAISATGLGLVVLDYTADTITLNAVAAALFDLPAGMSIPRSLLNGRYHPDDLQRVVDAIDHAAEPNGSPAIALDHRIVRPDGSIRWVSVHGQTAPARPPAAHQATATLALLDITKDIAAQQALLASEQQFRAIFENVAVGVATIALDGRWLSVNDTACSIFGCTADELLNVTLQDVTFTPGDAPGAIDLVALSSGRVETCQIQTQAKRRDGSLIWIDLTIGASRATPAEPGYYIAVVQDISERKAAEKQLAETEAELRQFNQTLETRVAERTAERDRAWANSYDLLCVLDGDGTLSRVNPAWTSILGWQPEDLIGQPFMAFSLPNPAAPSDPVTPPPHLPQSEMRIRHKDGSDRWIAWVAAEEGGLIYANGRHITAEKEAAEALARAEDLLRQGQKMEAIGRLAAGVAHDFNNILQVIVSGLELVMDELEASTPGAIIAEVALTAAQRGSTLTHSLLSYARKQVLTPHAVELVPFLSHLRELLSRTLGPNIAIDVKVQGNPFIIADPGQLQTALLNLAINAMHAMPRGGTLRFDVFDEGAFVVMRVTDTGSGMSPSTMARAVEPFFTTKGLEGTGLGLSMVQGFVGQSGGQFTLSSTQGEGTVVELKLPASKPRTSADATSIAAPQPLGRILLVDDSPDVLATTGLFLERQGFKVVRASSGTEALAKMHDGAHFDALVTDYAMPDMNGADLINEIRSIQPGLPALIITGFTGFTDLEKLPENTAVLQKPFGRTALLDEIAAIMKPL